MIYRGFVLTISCLLFAGSTLAEPSVPPILEIARSVQADIKDSSRFNLETCNEFLDSRLDLLRANGQSLFFEKGADAEAKKAIFETYAPEIIETFQDIRFGLRSQVASWFDLNNTNPQYRQALGECSLRLRRAMRYGRYIEESLTEWYADRRIGRLGAPGSRAGRVEAERAKAPKLVDPPHDFAKNHGPLNLIVNKEASTYSQLDTPEEKANFDIVDFAQPGDVFAVRGSTFVSAAIARIADEDGQFSHAAYVAGSKDDPENKFVVEALIETGLIITPLREWIEKQQHARVALFRGKNEYQRCYERGSRFALSRSMHLVGSEQDNYPEYGYGQYRLDRLMDSVQLRPKYRVGSDTVPYNFTMNKERNDKLFCSQVVSKSIDSAAQFDNWISLHEASYDNRDLYSMVPDRTVDEFLCGKLDLPTFPSKMSRFFNYRGQGQIHPFLASMGIDSQWTFAPSDMDIEPTAELLIEWRDFSRMQIEDVWLRKTQVVKLQDAIFEELFHQMAQNHYRVSSTFMADRIANGVQVMSYFSRLVGFQRYETEKLPEDMPIEFFKQIYMFNDTIFPKVQRGLMQKEAAEYPLRGYTMHFDEAKEHVCRAIYRDCLNNMVTAKQIDKQRLRASQFTSSSLTRFGRFAPDTDLQSCMVTGFINQGPYGLTQSVAAVPFYQISKEWVIKEHERLNCLYDDGLDQPGRAKNCSKSLYPVNTKDFEASQAALLSLPKDSCSRRDRNSI